VAKTKPTAADYPFVLQIEDEMAQTAVRIVNDKLASLADAAIPLEGRLIPDERPTGLDSRATSMVFFATDFARAFRWSGAEWEDLPGQDPRNLVAWFAPTGPPGTTLTIPGWALCTGKIVQQTTSTGALVSLQTPVIQSRDGLMAYIRL
jgi:hypothetical protein